MAMYQMVADWGDEKLSAGRMSQGVFGVALGSVLAGVIGGFSTIVYPDNMGMLRDHARGFALRHAGGGRFADRARGRHQIRHAVGAGAAAGGVRGGHVAFRHRLHARRADAGGECEWDDRKFIVAGMAMLVGLGGMFVAPEALRPCRCWRDCSSSSR